MEEGRNGRRTPFRKAKWEGSDSEVIGQWRLKAKVKEEDEAEEAKPSSPILNLGPMQIKTSAWKEKRRKE
jgi:hypothetical protein